MGSRRAFPSTSMSAGIAPAANGERLPGESAMSRGFLKVPRSLREHPTWLRGPLYQGIMINFLMRAVWRETLWQGERLSPGEFGVVQGTLFAELGLTRGEGRRLIQRLARDGFAHVRNVRHRFSIVTLPDWPLWQTEGEGAAAAASQPCANAAPASYKEEEKKELRAKSGENAPAPLKEESGCFPALQKAASNCQEDAPRGEYGHVRLSRAEWEALRAAEGADVAAEAVALLDAAIEARGADPWAASHPAAMKKWVIDAVWEKRARRARANAALGSPLPKAETLAGRNLSVAAAVLARRREKPESAPGLAETARPATLPHGT